MAVNSEMQIGPWVDERLAALRTGDRWEPNLDAALARLRSQRDARRGHGPRWFWAAALSTAAAVGLVALPAPRALAQRCLSCSVALWQSLAAAGPARANLTPEKSRKPAPDFTLTDDSGKLLRLSNLRGRVVLLNFWATWCHGCKTEIPWFVEFQQAYRNRGFVVLGVSRDDDGWQSVRPYISQKKINYRMAIGTGAIAAMYGADQSLPITLIIDKAGRIAATHAGVVRKSDCQAEIEALL